MAQIKTQDGAQGEQQVRSGAVLGITDTDRMNWLEAQQPDTLIVQENVVSTTLRGAIDEAIKRERAAVKPNDQAQRPLADSDAGRKGNRE